MTTTSEVKTVWRWWFVAVLAVFAFGLTSAFEASIVCEPPFALPIGLSTGIAVAAAALLGYRLCLGIFAASWVCWLCLLYPHLSDSSLLLLRSSSAAVVDTIGVWVGAWVLRRTDDSGFCLDQPGRVIRLLVSVVAAAGLRGVAESVNLWWSTVVAWDDLMIVSSSWLLAQLHGGLIIAGLILVWGNPRRVSWSAWKYVEAGVGLAVAGAVGYGLWMEVQLPGMTQWVACLGMAWLLWAVLRFEMIESILAVGIVAGLTLCAGLQETASSVEGFSLAFLWRTEGFVLMMSLTAVALAAAVCQSRGLISDSDRLDGMDSPGVIARVMDLEHRQKRLHAEVVVRHRMEEAVRRARVHAETDSDAKSEFLANMSHEIRTPLTAILAYTDQLANPDLQSRDHRVAVDGVQRNCDLLMTIINDIVDLSRIEAGRLCVRRTPCSPVQIIDEVSQIIQGLAQSKQLNFEIQYASAIPESVHTDPTRLRQILVNLLGNAIKFTQSGSIQLVVRMTPGSTLGPDTAYPHLQLDVVDTGSGMTRSQQARLFDAFSQSDTHTTRQFGGTGLGLMISKRLSEMLGGDITVRSAPNMGSTFCVTIDPGPTHDVPLIEPTSESRTETPPSPVSIPIRGVDSIDATILLVEDNLDFQQLIHTLLKAKGARVVVVDNGRLACETVKDASLSDEPFDMILVDMQMPELDGYSATTKIRKNGYEGPIIALTAHALVGARDKCLQAGCDDYLAKPIDKGQLLDTIVRHLPPEKTLKNELSTASPSP